MITSAPTEDAERMQKRKRNRLPDYDYRQPGAYFITVCVKNHKCILGTVVGADDHIGPKVQLTQIGKTVDQYIKQIPGIGQHVVMPNHVHMILHISATDPREGPMWSSAPTGDAEGGPMWSSAPTVASVPSLVRTWKTLITKALGESIWQRGYYDHIIRSEQEYVEIAEYIIGNPGKWAADKYFSVGG